MGVDRIPVVTWKEEIYRLLTSPLDSLVTPSVPSPATCRSKFIKAANEMPQLLGILLSSGQSDSEQRFSGVGVKVDEEASEVRDVRRDWVV